MKRILVTFVSGTDPYTEMEQLEKDENGNIKKDKDGNNISVKVNGKPIIERRDGSILHILRHYNTPENPIQEVYIYYTEEFYHNREIYKEAIKYFEMEDQNIQINEYPKKNEDLKVAVHLYGTLFPAINEIIKEIEEKNKEEGCEILFNITSGTAAMKFDLYLASLTNILPSNFNFKMIQVSTPAKKSNIAKDVKKLNINTLKDVLKDVSDEEEIIDDNRAKESDFTSIRRVLLLDSIQDSFYKKDYAGVYDNIEKNQNLFNENKRILEYAQNLYYRYIGNDAKAKGYGEHNDIKIKRLSDEMIKELYPINHQEYKILIEKINTMKVKAERQEINDWLLIAITVIEEIFKYLVENNFRLKIKDLLVDQNYREKIIQQNRNRTTGNKIKVPSLESICVEKVNDPRLKLSEEVKNILLDAERRGGYINVFVLKQMLNTIENKFQYDCEVLDCIREFRNGVAHHFDNIDENYLNKGLRKNIQNVVESINRNSINNITINTLIGRNEMNQDGTIKTIEVTESRIKKIMNVIIPDEYKTKIEYAYNINDMISNKIVYLIKEEINEENEVVSNG